MEKIHEEVKVEEPILSLVKSLIEIADIQNERIMILEKALKSKSAKI